MGSRRNSWSPASSQTAAGWPYDVASLGIPSPVLRGAVMEEPWNLGRGWVGFDFAAALGVPVRIINDAAMQALGSYEGGRMLFLGLGSGLGTTLIDDGRIVALELAHLPYRDATFEDICGQRGLRQLGEDGWRAAVLDAAEQLRAAVAAEYVDAGRRQRPPLRRTAAAHPSRQQRSRLRGRLPRCGPTSRRCRPPGRRCWRTPRSGASRRRRRRSSRCSTPPIAPSTFTLRLDDLVVDYSKNLITAETMTPPDGAGAGHRRRAAARSHVRGRARSTAPRDARCCTSRCATARRGRSAWTAAT